MTSPAPPTGDAFALEIRGLSHAFGARKALENVGLSVPRGIFTALLGPNGAGKSTLFALVTRLYDNVSGEIRVCGHDVRREPGRALARLGVVFQSRALDSDLSLRRNLHYHAALHGYGRAEAKRRTEAMLERVGLLEQADAKLRALSGGQARRAEIARALLHEPELLLFDEATAGLDIPSRRAVVALARDMVREQGAGALWATHLVDELEPGDHVVVLDKGRVLAAGTGQEVIRAAGAADLKGAYLALTGAGRANEGEAA